MSNIYDKLKAGTTPLMALFKNPTQATWERVTRVSGAGGDIVETWVSQGSLNVILIPLGSSEPVQAGRLESKITQKIYILYDDAKNITALDRIVYKTRVFNIDGIPQNIAEGGLWIKFDCIEGVAT